MKYRFAGGVDLNEKAVRSGLLLLIIGLLMLFLDLRIQGLNLLPDSIGALLSALSIRRIISHITNAQKLLTHLRRSLYALTGAILFMIPDIYQASQSPRFVVQFYPSSMVLAAFWTGSLICELVAILSLILAVGAWASVVDDKSLGGLSKTTFRWIVGATMGYVVSFSLSLIAAAPGWGIAGLLAIIAVVMAIVSLISRLLLIYSLVRTRRTSKTVLRTLNQIH